MGLHMSCTIHTKSNSEADRHGVICLTSQYPGFYRQLCLRSPSTSPLTQLVTESRCEHFSEGTQFIIIIFAQLTGHPYYTLVATPNLCQKVLDPGFLAQI